MISVSLLNMSWLRPGLGCYHSPGFLWEPSVALAARLPEVCPSLPNSGVSCWDWPWALTPLRIKSKTLLLVLRNSFCTSPFSNLLSKQPWTPLTCMVATHLERNTFTLISGTSEHSSLCLETPISPSSASPPSKVHTHSVPLTQYHPLQRSF